MDELKLKRLSAKITDFSINYINLPKRVKAEHPFNSINQCLEYLDMIICNKRINPDDPNSTTIESLPVLYANIIDEAVCSVIYESFLLINRKDPDALSYFRIQIDEFCDHIIHERDKLPVDSKKINVYNALHMFLSKISVILHPAAIKAPTEETEYGYLSIYYYNLMFTIYGYLSNSREPEYSTRLRFIYAKYLNDSLGETVPMNLEE